MKNDNLSHLPLWIFISIQFLLLVVVTLFFTYYWESRTIEKVNAILSEQTQEFNAIVDTNNKYVDEEVGKVYAVLQPSPTPTRAVEKFRSVNQATPSATVTP